MWLGSTVASGASWPVLAVSRLEPGPSIGSQRAHRLRIADYSADGSELNIDIRN
jgi:hypothetical protein